MSIKSNLWSFAEPYFRSIDSGEFFRKPASWNYAALAALSLLAPVVLFFLAVTLGIFRAPFIVAAVALLCLLVIGLAGIVNAQLWWDRRSQIVAIKLGKSGHSFVAIPVLSHFIQTMGESIGLWVGIALFGSTALVCWLREEAANIFYYLPLPGSGVLSSVLGASPFILSPMLLLFGFVACYSITLVTRATAELLRASPTSAAAALRQLELLEQQAASVSLADTSGGSVPRSDGSDT